MNKKFSLGLSDEMIDRIYSRREECLVCVTNKAQRQPLSRQRIVRFNAAQAIMDCWHVDLMGPFSTINPEDGRRWRLPSITGESYILMATDENSHFIMGEPLVTKSKAPEALIDLVIFMENQTGVLLKRIHGDGGGEFVNSRFLDFCRSKGIEFTHSTADTPELNSIAEAANKLVTTKARCLIQQCGAAEELWSLALLHAIWIHNHSCQKTVGGEIPAKRMSQGKETFDVTVDKFHVFGCNAHVLITQSKRGKFQSRTRPGIYVGYSRKQNAHKILMANSLLIEVHRDVTFNEGKFDHLSSVQQRVRKLATSTLTSAHGSDKEWEVDFIDGETTEKGRTEYLVFWKGYPEPTWEPKSNLTHCDDLIDEFRQRRQVQGHAFSCVALKSTSSRFEYVEPNSYTEAMRHPDKEKWTEAIHLELKSMDDRNVFQIAALPPGRKAIECRWVLKVKRDENNRIVRHKARLVIKGFRQQEGIDYTETFAPTVRMKSVKALLAIAAAEDLEIQQIDFDTAFLNGVLKEDIFMKVPQGYRHHVPKGMVLKLVRALYGLKQAPRVWYKELEAMLLTLGYKPSRLDEGLFMKVVRGKRMYLSIYVDDVLAVFPNQLRDVWLHDKLKISTKWAIKDIGDCEWILNMAITRDRKQRTITLSQHAYVELMLSEYEMDNCRPATTPFLYQDLGVCPENVVAEPLSEKDHKLYQSIVGSLLYAANITRIDTCYIVSILTRHVNQPFNFHLAAARRVLQYLRGTSERKLVFSGPQGPPTSSTDLPAGLPQHDVQIYTDSNWAGDHDDRKSTGGHVTQINGRPISWQSKKQTTVAKSSTEAEYYALAEATSEALFMRQWMDHYVGQLMAIPIKCDNQGAIHLADHSTNHNRTKHIDVKHFFVRDHVLNKEITVGFVPTKDQYADILTKATATNIFVGLRDRLMDAGSENPIHRILE